MCDDFGHGGGYRSGDGLWRRMGGVGIRDLLPNRGPEESDLQVLSTVGGVCITSKHAASRNVGVLSVKFTILSIRALIVERFLFRTRLLYR